MSHLSNAFALSPSLSLFLSVPLTLFLSSLSHALSLFPPSSFSPSFSLFSLPPSLPPLSPLLARSLSILPLSSLFSHSSLSLSLCLSLLLSCNDVCIILVYQETIRMFPPKNRSVLVIGQTDHKNVNKLSGQQIGRE